MIQMTKVFNRPTTDVRWHKHVLDRVEDRNYIKATYIDTGKLIVSKPVISKDGLKMTIVLHWKDQASMAEYDSDPKLAEYRKLRDDYNKLMNIGSVPAKIAKL